MDGLKGPVLAVLTEFFQAEGGVSDKPNFSLYEIYDRRGFELEVFRYKPDGSPWVHTIITRNGDKIFRSQTIGTAPFQSYSEENVFDAKGRVIETDEYDGDGILLKKTTWKFEGRDQSSTTRWTETNGNGTENTTEAIETVDPETGATRQVSKMNGILKSQWVFQGGVLPKNKIVFPDGSYNERDQEPDGSTDQDTYRASINSHTYQKTDAQGHVTEVIEKSDTSYLRCTYAFDEKDRPAGQINYDALGKIVDKTTTEYIDDSFGNWVEQRKFLWDTKSELPKQKIVEITFRTINYY